MLELSMHILDIVENSTRAGAKLVQIHIVEDKKKDKLFIDVSDDGEGMDKETLKKTLDPFFTSKTVRKIGLGLPMLHQATKSTEGHFSIESKKGKGTRVTADFRFSYVDRQPLGDITSTIISLIAGDPEVDFVYSHQNGELTYAFDTREIREELEGIPMNNPEVLRFIRTNIEEGLKEIRTSG
ncbi:sensor histidine kinase [Candidatus Pacearchaeota archaeon]|nr:sensor histidine kinase [Candidatus Pacearchaeota archaeon]